jgi:membrane protein YqaA with SNARE-associated domain
MTRLWKLFLAQLERPGALWIMALYVALISAAVPLPVEPALLVVTLTNSAKPRFVFLITLIATTLGGSIGYFLAAPFASIIGMPAIPNIAAFGLVAVFLSAVLPLPHQPFVIAAGLLHVPFVVFLAAYVAGRAIHCAVVIWIVAAARRIMRPRDRILG